MRSRVLVLSLALLAGAPRAATAAGPPRPARTALSLTVSGGVSLGAYEAGFLYYALELSRANPGLFDVRLATGASAGSINALLSLLSSCQGEPEPPRQGLFWRTWVPVGFRQLFVPADTTAEGAFSRRFLEEAAVRIEEAWNRGLRETCDAVFVVAVTRVDPLLVETAGGRLELPVAEEKFAVRVRGRGPGRPPSVTNHADPGWAFPQALLPEAPDGQVSFASLRELLFASSAFPVAFPPQPVRHCMVTAGREPLACPADRAGSALFVDGGIFDNNPLRAAVNLAGHGLRERADGAPGWLPAPAREFALPRNLSFVSLSADAVAYPTQREERREPEQSSLTGLLGRLASTLVGSARSKELLLVVEEHPEVAARVVYPRRHHPAASDPLYAFFGFFETEFRAFDFALGMAEARRHVQAGLMAELAASGAPPVLPPEPFGESWPEGGPSDWKPFACMRGVYEGIPGLARACEGEELASFRALLQVSLMRLYDLCAPASGAAVAAANHRQCAAALRGEPPPLVPGVPGADRVDWHRGAREGETDYVVRLLESFRFDFRDLGVPPGSRGLALRRIRQDLGELVDQLARAQPPSQRAVVHAAGTLAANAVAYAPPSDILYVTLGRELEVGWSHGFRGLGWLLESLRLQLALQIPNFPQLISSDGLPFAFTPLGGPEILPPGLSSSALQFSLALRAGYLFSYGDRFGSQACVEPGSGFIGGCSRFLAQAGFAVGILQVVRLQLLGEWYPAARGAPALWSISPAIGFQLGL